LKELAVGSTAEQIALWSDKLRDISAMGLNYSKNIHDEGAFRAVQTIAMEMLASATGESLAQIEPLRDTVFARPTPLTVGDAAVIDGDGRMLLIRRADNGKWAMPGGALEVGETPAEGVVREALEETGVHCRPVTLVGVFDSRLCGTNSRHQLCMFVFLCEPLDRPEIAEPSHALEVTDKGWFAEDELPEDLDPGHRFRIPEAFRVWRGDGRAFFDQNVHG
jgi:ADP-ribose pyrophosphatase YjhB (NUDIX family)